MVGYARVNGDCGYQRYRSEIQKNSTDSRKEDNLDNEEDGSLFYLISALLSGFG